MRLEHFDINRIVTLSVFGEKVERSYEWRDPQPIKRFFGLIDTGRFTPAGYYYTNSFESVCYTEEKLRGYGFKVYSRDERINDNVVNKPYVKVDLEHENSLTVTFETNDEMLEWVEMIKLKSGKIFETVVYE